MTPQWKTLMFAIAVGSIGAGPGASAPPILVPRALAMQPAATRPAVTQPAAAPTHEPTTAQLLEEVRALRAAIERMTVAGTRAQLLLGRLQMQEERMTSLSRQLQETRARLVDVQRERQNKVLEADRFNEALNRAMADERPHVEMALKMLKQSIRQLDQQTESLQTEDVGIGQALSSEQARWIELNARLEELETLLATQKP